MTGPRELPTEVLAAAEMSKKTHASIFKPAQRSHKRLPDTGYY